MPRYTMDVDGQQVTGFICGPRLKACVRCGALAERLCDYIMTRSPRIRRCSAPVCRAHTTRLPGEKDACPQHAEACLAALKRREERLQTQLLA